MAIDTAEPLWFPVVDASLARNQDVVCLRLQRWFVGQVLSYALGLEHERFWAGTDTQVSGAIDDLKNQIADLIAGVDCASVSNCPDCPDCPDCPTGIGTGSGGIAQGTISGLVSPVTGLTVQVMEDLIMSSIQDLRCVDGVIQVLRFGCCEWENLCSIGGVSVGGKPSTEINTQEWDGAGQPTLPSFGTAHIGDPIISASADGIRCVKANALCDMLYSMVEMWIDILDAVDAANLSTEVVMGAIIAEVLAWELVIPTLVAVTLVIYLNDLSISGLQAEAAAIEGASATWAQFRCDLVTTLEYGADISTEDFYRTLTQFATAFAIEGSGDDEDPFIHFVKLVPISWLIARASGMSDDTSCDCDLYLPASYYGLPATSLQVTPAGIGVLLTGSPNGSFKSYTGITDRNEPFNGTVQGALYGENYAQTVNLGSGNGSNNGLAMVYDFSGQVTLNSISWLFSVENFGSTPTTVQSYAYRQSDTQWRPAQDDETNRSVGFEQYNEAFTALNTIDRVIVMLRHRNTNSANQVTGKLYEIKFNVVFNGQSFDIRPGETYDAA